MDDSPNRTWTYAPEQLDDLKRELTAAGASAEAAAYAVVELLAPAARSYKWMAMVERERPRPAGLRAELKKIETAAATLLELLNGSSSAAFGAIAVAEYEAAKTLVCCDKIPTDLMTLLHATRMARETASQNSGVGRPKMDAQRHFMEEVAAAWWHATRRPPSMRIPSRFECFAKQAYHLVSKGDAPDDLIREAAKTVRAEGEIPPSKL